MADESHQMNPQDNIAVNADNPWPGLLAYGEADQAFFHGRQAETDALIRLVMRESLTVLFGLSGLGKTSLLRAGLFPRLRQLSVLPIYIRLGFSPDHPGFADQVMESILSQASAADVEAPKPKDGQTLWEYFHRRDADFWNRRNRLQLPFLVFDQFEEIFTLGRSDANSAAASEAFLSELGDFIEGRPPVFLKEYLDKHPENVRAFEFGRHYYKILFSLREDFIPELEGLRDRIPSIIYNRLRLSRMSGEAAFQAVAHPRHLIDPSVAQQVVRFVSGSDQPDGALEKLALEPALLSVVCRELNNKRQQRQETKITENLLEGSQKEILSGFYHNSIADLGPEVRAFVEEQLLTVSGYRDSVALENALITPGITHDDIKKLVDRRLIRREERMGMQRLELTHDILTEVIADSRDLRRRIEAAEKRGNEIAETERLRRLEERAKSARRFRWLSAALAALFLLALIALYGAWIQTNRVETQRKIAETQREIAENEQKKAEELRKIAEKERAAVIEAQKVANQRLQRIVDSIELRQAVLSKDKDALKQKYQTSVETEIQFKATAKAYPYKSVGGLPTFRYQLFPDVNSIPGGLKSVALITYIMDHPSFLNRLISAGPDSRFTGTYDGVGCLPIVTAVIEYTDINKPLTIAKINMCGILKYLP